MTAYYPKYATNNGKAVKPTWIDICNSGLQCTSYTTASKFFAVPAPAKNSIGVLTPPPPPLPKILGPRWCELAAAVNVTVAKL